MRAATPRGLGLHVVVLDGYAGSRILWASDESPTLPYVRHSPTLTYSELR